VLYLDKSNFFVQVKHSRSSRSGRVSS